MHYTTALLIASSFVGAACADQRAPAPSDASQVELNAAENAAATDVPSEHQHVPHESQAASEPGLPNAQQQASTRSDTATQTASKSQADAAEQAHAAFTSAAGYELRGAAEFKELANGVEVRVAVSGAPPGFKGIHIHQKADCSDIPNKSMGGHFEPGEHGHGFPTAQEHHLGDLGNIQIGPDGAGELTIVVPSANLKDADARSFLTRSIVVHESNDKGGGESGDAGKPIACGVIDR